MAENAGDGDSANELAHLKELLFVDSPFTSLTSALKLDDLDNELGITRENKKDSNSLDMDENQAMKLKMSFEKEADLIARKALPIKKNGAAFLLPEIFSKEKMDSLPGLTEIIEKARDDYAFNFSSERLIKRRKVSNTDECNDSTDEEDCLSNDEDFSTDDEEPITVGDPTNNHAKLRIPTMKNEKCLDETHTSPEETQKITRKIQTSSSCIKTSTSDTETPDDEVQKRIESIMQLDISNFLIEYYSSTATSSFINEHCPPPTISDIIKLYYASPEFADFVNQYLGSETSSDIEEGEETAKGSSVVYETRRIRRELEFSISFRDEFDMFEDDGDFSQCVAETIRDPVTGKITKMLDFQFEPEEVVALKTLSVSRESAQGGGIRGSVQGKPFCPGGLDLDWPSGPTTLFDDKDDNFKTLSSEVFMKLDCSLISDCTHYQFDSKEEEEEDHSETALNNWESFAEALEEKIDAKSDDDVMKSKELENSFMKLYSDIRDDQKGTLSDFDTDDEDDENKSPIVIDFENILCDDEKDDEITLILKRQADIIAEDERKSVEIERQREAEILASDESKKWVVMVDVEGLLPPLEDLVASPAKTYSFPLDTFQKQAILKLEENKHVFVSAHTSAGKTVIAEYAIALSRRYHTKAIYTSPIKALSNQKYRDFKNTFGDVGLVTGDVQINTSASCLVMTTEILRSMLFRGADTVRDLQFVIFDEVHYINDSDRGHVWEEALIMLPRSVVIVMLSATVPNTEEFADWVGSTKKSIVYVVKTLQRPVPLVHYLYITPTAPDKDPLYAIKNGDGPFLNENYKNAYAALPEKKAKDEKDGRPSKPNDKSHSDKQPSERQMWLELNRFVKEREFLPVVAFVLSRKRCDSIAEMMESSNLTTAKEKARIKDFFRSKTYKLNDEDKNLPQVLKMERLLIAGIGIHHAGILPLLKEIVEMLFQIGVIKVLIATETFAMGINMPTRTIVFDSITKYDGDSWRDLQPQEYTQMAGRAGRRGQDKVGHVLIMCKNNIPSTRSLTSMMMGKPVELTSQFRVTYSMILNLKRTSEIPVEKIMSHSFKELNNRRNQKIYRELLSELHNVGNEALAALTPLEEDTDDFVYLVFDYLEKWDERCCDLLVKAREYMNFGRILKITHEHHINKLAIILNKKPLQPPRYMQYNVLVLCDSNKDGENQASGDGTCDSRWYRLLGLMEDTVFYSNQPNNYTVLQITASSIMEITTHSSTCNMTKLVDELESVNKYAHKNFLQRALQELTELSFAAQNSGYNLPVYSLKLKNIDPDTAEVLDNFVYFKNKISEKRARFSKVPDMRSKLLASYKRESCKMKRIELEFKLSDASLLDYADYENKMEVLKELEYIKDDLVHMKGKVACEIGSHELVLTELIFNNFNGELVNFTPEEMAALLSCFAFKSKTKCKINISEKLAKGVQIIEDEYRRISELEVKHNVGFDDAKLELEAPNFGLVGLVYEWAMGKPFSAIMSLIDDVQEGTIVRCIQQLHETLRDVRDAARVISGQSGRAVLGEKMTLASKAIKRDIVFAQSLYIE